VSCADCVGCAWCAALLKGERKMSTTSTIKSEAISGAVRFGAKKLNASFRDAIVNFISGYVDADAARQFARFLNTPIGEALLSFGMSQAIKHIPIDSLKKNPYFSGFAKELSVNSFALAAEAGYDQGELLFKTFVKPMLGTLAKVPGLNKDPEVKRLIDSCDQMEKSPEEIGNVIGTFLAGGT
jgi:hypothetical protein